MKTVKRQLETSGAIFDLSGRYRYLLWRDLERGTGMVSFVMLNPNRADEAINDPTITRCARFAQDWGYKRLEVINLFALRAKTPRELIRSNEPVGELNDQYLLESLTASTAIIAAWGNYGGHMNRSEQILKLSRSHKFKLHCLQINKSGEPKHPLYVSKKSIPIEFLVNV